MMLWHLKNLSGWGETGPLRASQFLQRAKGSARSMPSISKLTSPETYISVWPIHCRRQCPSVPIMPELQETRDHPRANPEMACLSRGNPNNDSDLDFPLLLPSAS